jgi:uncharacterized protein YkwD
MKKALIGLLALVASLALLAGSATAGSTQPTRAIASVNVLAADVLTEVNALRSSRGLVPLKLNAKLSAAAEAHSRAMASAGFFAHESADGSAFWKRVQRFYASNGFGLWSVGENLLWSSPDVDAPAALKLWMESPAHRENLLTPKWREIGLAAVHVTGAPGTFKGMDVTIVTADFGVRR